MGLIKKIAEFNNSSKGKMVKSFAMLVLSMVMVICSTYAWFFKSVNVGSNNMQLTTKYEVMNASFTSFYYEELNTNEVTKGVQYQNEQGQNVLDIKLLPYDMTFKSTNGYKSIVVRIQIYDVDSIYIPVANQTKYVNLVVSRNTSLSFTTSNELDEYFSSIGQIAFYTDTTLALDDDEEDIYDTISAKYRADKENTSNQNIKKFTTYSNSTYTKAGQLSANMSYTTANFLTDENDEQCLVFYLCFDYNNEMADAYAEQESASMISAGLEHHFGMLNDIASIGVQFA